MLVHVFLGAVPSRPQSNSRHNLPLYPGEILLRHSDDEITVGDPEAEVVIGAGHSDEDCGALVSSA